ncbi:MAG: RDD family protein [Bacteroidales bacterium]
MKRLSNIWRRLGSIIIDMAIINMFTSIFLWFVSPLGFITANKLFVDLFLVILYLLILILISYGYQYLMIKKFDRSFGKMLLNLQYTNKKGRRVKKEILYQREFSKYYLLYATLGIYGVYVLFMILFTNKKIHHEAKYNAYVSAKE